MGCRGRLIAIAALSWVFVFFVIRNVAGRAGRLSSLVSRVRVSRVSCLWERTSENSLTLELTISLSRIGCTL